MSLTNIAQRKWDFLLITQNKSSVYLNILQMDIVLITASRSYCSIQTVSKEYVLSQPMGEIEDMLNPELFLRIGRSYIINPLYLKSVVGYVLTFDFNCRELSITVPHAPWDKLLPNLPIIGKRKRVLQKQRERIKKRYSEDGVTNSGG